MVFEQELENKPISANSQVWGFAAVISAPRKLRQKDCCEFKSSLGHTVSA